MPQATRNLELAVWAATMAAFVLIHHLCIWLLSLGHRRATIHLALCLHPQKKVEDQTAFSLDDFISA